MLSPIYSISGGVLVVIPLTRFHTTGRVERFESEKEGEKVVEVVEYLPHIVLSNGVEVPIIPYNTINGCTKHALFKYTVKNMFLESIEDRDFESRYEKLMQRNPSLGVLMSLKIPYIKPYMRDLDFKVKVFMNPFLSIYSFGIGKRVVSYSDAYPITRNLESAIEIKSRIQVVEYFNEKLKAEGFNEIPIPEVVTKFTEFDFKSRRRLDVTESTENQVIKYFAEKLGLSIDKVREYAFIKSIIWRREFMVAHVPLVSFVRVKVTHPLPIEHIGALVASIVELDSLGRETNQFQVHLVCTIENVKTQQEHLLYVMRDNATNRVTMSDFAKKALEAYTRYIQSDEFVKELNEIANYVFSK